MKTEMIRYIGCGKKKALYAFINIIEKSRAVTIATPIADEKPVMIKISVEEIMEVKAK